MSILKSLGCIVLAIGVMEDLEQGNDIIKEPWEVYHGVSTMAYLQCEMNHCK